MWQSSPSENEPAVSRISKNVEVNPRSAQKPSTDNIAHVFPGINLKCGILHAGFKYFFLG
jgi:hypothetical protein